MRKLFLLLMILVFFGFFGCASLQQPVSTEPTKHEIEITLKQVDGKVIAVAKEENGTKHFRKFGEINNPGLSLSQLSGIPESNDRCFIKLFSGLSVSDVTRTWNDLIYLENNTKIKDVHLFIDSPGGDAFSGLALADTIESFQKKGFRFTAHATGIIASAAVPVFVVCDETHATQATIFMVHEAALWKWPGRETASDIRSQGALMNLLQKLYLNKLAVNSNLTYDEWEVLEAKTSWFGVAQAKEWGLLDYID